MWQLAVVRDSKGVVRRSMEVEEELQVFTGMKSNPLFDHLQNTRIMFCPLKDEAVITSVIFFFVSLYKLLFSFMILHICHMIRSVEFVFKISTF